jgi:hypothetical protein
VTLSITDEAAIVAMRSPEPDNPRPIRDLLRRLIKAPAALAFVWPVLMIICGYVSWQHWGADHFATQFSGVDMTQIQINPPPSHVRTNVVKAVYRDTAMESLSLMDQQATAKIAAAFSMNPWVRKVVSVRKLPGGEIDVRLEYRAPVAMVLVFKSDPEDKQSYFLPVDGEGILLPSSEFSRAETKQFIHIEVPHLYASNRFVGTPFGDFRVESAARLAAVLTPYREQLQLHSIGVLGDPRQNEVTQLELTTQTGTRIPWGSPPGEEADGEPTTQMKLRTLLSGQSNSDLHVATPVTGGVL